MVKQLGIGRIYATPYHGAAKTVERFFGTFTDRFSRRFDTYTGTNAKNRPECMQISNDKILLQAPEFNDFIALLHAYIAEYNQTPNGGADMDGKCPDQVYFENLTAKRTVSDIGALRLLCGSFEERIVHKNGVSIKNNHYFNDELLHHLDKRVIVSYDPENMDQMAIFDMDGRKICMASAKIRTPFRHTTEEDYRRAAKEKKKARAIVAAHKPLRDRPIHDIIARNQLMEKDYSENANTAATEQIIPQSARKATVLRPSAQTRAEHIEAEDNISAIMLKSYQKEA